MGSFWKENVKWTRDYSEDRAAYSTIKKATNFFIFSQLCDLE